jgi:hypothetical protein
VDAGVRLKFMRSYYTHFIADRNAIENSQPALPAVEMNGESVLKRNGIGVDLGLLIHPRDYEGFSSALVVTNLISPNFRFTGTDATSFHAPVNYDLMPRSVSGGVAMVHGKSITAFDLVDVTSAYGNPQARVGMEYTSRGFSLRGGYASSRGFIVGFGWGFLDLAFGGRAPLEITQTLKF